MFEDALPAAQQQLCMRLSALAVVQTCYRAGGTAAALHLGHWDSVDLDSFRDGVFAADAVGVPVAEVAAGRRDHYERNTLVGGADGGKLSFFHDPYPLLQPAERFAGLAVASALDVARIKLVAIGQRGLQPVGTAFLAVGDRAARYGHVSEAENVALSFKNAALCH